jgi:tRNA A37 threonylcarbamoyltransferase TsaD
MKILSIETSCDETAVSIIEATGDIHHPKFTILGNALYSQISVHAEYGGVFPALAKREHTQNLVPMLKLATELAFEKDSNILNSNSSTTNIPEITKEKRLQILEILSKENDLGDQLLNFLDTHEVFDVDAIAVTQGPGLEPALWVGISFAKALAIALRKPLIPINHMEGHIVSVLMESNEQSDSIEGDNKNTNGDNKDCDNKEIGNTDSDCSGAIQFPALALLISGGHTELVLSKNWHQYEVIGQTVDDAVGEAFDKVARIMNLPYPGGPKISKLAAESRTENVCEKVKGDTGTYPWILPRPMLKSPDFNFSFSGLKTAVLYAVKDRLKNRIAAHTEQTLNKCTLNTHMPNMNVLTRAKLLRHI